MVNLKIGGLLLVVGAAIFLLSDTLLGESEAASYAVFLGLIMFPIGLVLTLVGIIQWLIARFRN
jgi:predicted phage tail protein